jgi:hypothetical protein
MLGGGRLVAIVRRGVLPPGVASGAMVVDKQRWNFPFCSQAVTLPLASRMNGTV